MISNFKMEQKQAIQIQHPCPMRTSRMEQQGSDFFCKGCSKTVYDFRGKSAQEVKSFAAGKNCCMVLDSTQVTQPQFSFRYRLHFAALTFLAFFGMQVKPIQAQSVNQDSLRVKAATKPGASPQDLNVKAVFETKERLIKRNLEALERKKKKNVKPYKIVGCPSF